jgi:apolipoprotein D and lipocalin family protein
MKVLGFCGLVASLLAGCSLFGPARPDIPLVAQVDLPRFMGDWYVIGFIPIYPERHAHNGIESYALNADGSIATTYRYRKGSFDAPLVTNRPKGFVVPGSNNALWGMQFIWPFKGEYRIVYLEPDYSVTIIARNARDYVWLLARRPEMSDAVLDRYREKIAAMGYDVGEFRRQPQRWPEVDARPPL